MSIIGIDLGTAEALIAAVNKGAVEIVQNEVSERKTPSLVGFTDTNRLLGSEAMAQIRSNAKNTCRDIKLLIGRSLNDPKDASDIDAERFFQLCQMAEAKDGDVGFKVKYLGEEQVYSASQVAGMLLTKLKDTTEASLKSNVNEAVIAVPSYYNDKQRQAILNASSIAGLNCVRVMNEHTATALSYGIYRSKEFDAEKPFNVMFCSMGHSHFSCSVVSFWNNKLQVVAEKCDRSLGGRFMDMAIMKHFASQFEKKYGEDPLSVAKARFKLEEAVNKCKKVLSANSESPINVECLIDDFDLSGKLDRETFEGLCGEMMAKVRAVIEATVKQSGLEMEKIDCVEVVGGSSRVPFVQEAIKEAVGKDVSKTLNADESVARGCALQAAMLSPLFKVREFAVADYREEPVSVGWAVKDKEHQEGDEDAMKDEAHVDGIKWMELFSERGNMDTVKAMSFHRKEPFDLHVKFGDQPAGTYRVHVPVSDTAKKVKVKCKVDLHGIFRVVSAVMERSYEKEVVTKVKVAKAKPQEEGKPEEPEQPAAEEKEEAEKKEETSEAEAKMSDEEKKEEKKEEEFEWVDQKEMKTFTEKVNIEVTNSGVNCVRSDVVEAWRKMEVSMIQTDRLVKETDRARNDLETLIYSLREKLDLDWSQCVTSQAKESFFSSLNTAEDWLYDTFDATKQVYEQKTKELREMVGDVEKRFVERQRTPESLQMLSKVVSDMHSKCSTPPEEINHIAQEKLQNILDECSRLSSWGAEKLSALEKTPGTESLSFSSSEVDATKSAFEKMAFDILKEPKPAPPTEEKKEEDTQMDEPKKETAAEEPTMETEESVDAAKEEQMQD